VKKLLLHRSTTAGSSSRCRRDARTTTGSNGSSIVVQASSLELEFNPLRTRSEPAQNRCRAQRFCIRWIVYFPAGISCSGNHHLGQPTSPALITLVLYAQVTKMPGLEGSDWRAHQLFWVPVLVVVAMGWGGSSESGQLHRVRKILTQSAPSPFTKGAVKKLPNHCRQRAAAFP
jgi:hypothetical protein